MSQALLISVVRTIELAMVVHHQRSPERVLKDTARRLRGKCDGDLRKLVKAWSTSKRGLISFQSTRDQVEHHISIGNFKIN